MADLKLDKVDINIRSKAGKYYKFINQVKSIKLWQWWNSWFQKYFRSIYTFTQRYANYFLNQNIGLEKYTHPVVHMHARPTVRSIIPGLIIIHIFIWFPKWFLISTLNREFIDLNIKSTVQWARLILARVINSSEEHSFWLRQEP